MNPRARPFLYTAYISPLHQNLSEKPCWETHFQAENVDMSGISGIPGGFVAQQLGQVWVADPNPTPALTWPPALALVSPLWPPEPYLGDHPGLHPLGQSRQYCIQRPELKICLELSA